jgi:protein SCO1/2
LRPLRAVALAVLVPAAAVAQPAADRPAALREVGFDQRLGETVPLDITLRDEAGRAVRLGNYFRGKPVALNLVYFECPMLCTMALNGLTGALGTLSFEPGREFEMVTVSFDHREGPELAAAKKATYLKRYGRPQAAAGWHFLTGDAAAIQALTRAVGFRYTWDDATAQFAHPSGLVVLTPEGRIARYLYGVEYTPKDLRLGLVEASEGRVGTAVDQAVLFCYRYDPMTGKYGLLVMRLVRVGGVLTVLALGTFIVVYRRPRPAEANAVRRPDEAAP